MKRLACIIGLTLAPVGLSAQGLAVDFDADAFETRAPRPETDTPAAPRIVETLPLRRSVRIAGRTILLNGAKNPAEPVALKLASRAGD